MFLRSQRFYDAIYVWKDYQGDTVKLHALIEERNPGARTLLDVACGTGKHLEHLKERYEVEGWTSAEWTVARLSSAPLAVNRGFRVLSRHGRRS